MIQPALFGGLFIGVLSALPIIGAGNLCCCLWIIGGGFFAAYIDAHYTSRTLTVGRGALDGFAAGVAGALIWLIVSLLLDPLVGPMQRRIAEEVANRSDAMPPEARAFFDAVASQSPSSFRWVIGFFLQLCLGAIFAPVGGMIGAVFFKKDVPPALGGSQPPGVDDLYPPPLP